MGGCNSSMISDAPPPPYEEKDELRGQIAAPQMVFPRKRLDSQGSVLVKLNSTQVADGRDGCVQPITPRNQSPFGVLGWRGSVKVRGQVTTMATVCGTRVVVATTHGEVGFVGIGFTTWKWDLCPAGVSALTANTHAVVVCDFSKQMHIFYMWFPGGEAHMRLTGSFDEQDRSRVCAVILIPFRSIVRGHENGTVSVRWCRFNKDFEKVKLGTTFRWRLYHDPLVEGSAARHIVHLQGTRFAVGFDDGMVRIFDVTDDKGNFALQYSLDARGAEERVDCALQQHPLVGVSVMTRIPTGHLVVGTTDGLVHMYGIGPHLAQMVWSAKAHATGVRALVWLRGGFLATAGDDGVARVWDMRHMDQWRQGDVPVALCEFSEHTSGITALVATNDDRTLTSKSQIEGMVWLWDVVLPGDRSVRRNKGWW